MQLPFMCLISLLFALATSQDQQTPSSNGCSNVCCQGVAGAPGIPGIPGVAAAGLPGRDGMKGEKGDPGLGQPVQACGSSRRSAFMAYKNADQSGVLGDVVTFQEVPTNINNHFSIFTNTFTCHVPGTYVFMFSILVYRPNDPMIHLVKNDNVIATAHARTHTITNDVDQASNNAILNLEVGDQVWLKFGLPQSTTIHDRNGVIYNTFTGYLLYEN